MGEFGELGMGDIQAARVAMMRVKRERRIVKRTMVLAVFEWQDQLSS